MILRKTVLLWALIIVPVTGIYVFLCASVQQNYRQSANDPQIQMAEDISAGLSKGTDPGIYVSDAKIDIGSSLFPFVIIYDASGKPLASSAELDGSVPVPPHGVFSAAEKFAGGCRGIGPFEPYDWKGCNGSENRITWQPEPGVRIATVIKKYPGGFVLAGRSLREIEKREDQLGMIAVASWIITAAATLVAAFLFSVFTKKKTGV